MTTVAVILVAQLLLVVPTYACSAGPDFNPVAEADLIVGGHITAWQRLLPVADCLFTPIQLTMAVDRRLKGDADPTLQSVEPSRLSAMGDQEVSVGSSGACGVFESDLTGSRCQPRSRSRP